MLLNHKYKISMKKILIVLLITTAVLSCQNSKPKIANLDDVLNNPSEYLNKKVNIQGIVNQIDFDKNQFSIIGKKEFEECGIGKCNINERLPVRFKGDFPTIKDKVEVSGYITKTEKGFIYEAKSIRNIKDLSNK